MKNNLLAGKPFLDLFSFDEAMLESYTDTGTITTITDGNNATYYSLDWGGTRSALYKMKNPANVESFKVVINNTATVRLRLYDNMGVKQHDSSLSSKNNDSVIKAEMSNILYVVFTTNTSSPVRIGEFELYKGNTAKHLIKSYNKIQVLSNGIWVDTGLAEPLSKLDFETHGMDDLSIILSEKWNELDTDFEIITWTNDLENDKFIEITTDPFSPMERLNQKEEFEVLTWTDDSKIVGKQSQGFEEAIDSGKMFKTVIEDFSVIIGEEIV